MKLFAAREFLLLCAPIALVGVGITTVRLLNPPRDPDAVIALKVTLTPLKAMLVDNFNYGWKVNAWGGPKDDIQLLYTQKLVASGHGRSQVLLEEPASTLNLPNSIGGSGSSMSMKRGDIGIEVRSINLVRDNVLPIWTEKLEWRGDVVALPQDSRPTDPWKVGKPAMFPTLARLKGAARATVTFPIALDASKTAPFQKLERETVSPPNADLGADTGVTTQLRSNSRCVYARLVAFDGPTKRQLWSNLQKFDRKYWKNQRTETNSYTWSDSQFFQLREVPVKWGEIVYIVDAAFDPIAGNANGAGNSNKPVDAAAIERLERAGWLTFSKRLTLRRAGTKIVALNYPKTPNTQFLGAQTSVEDNDWVIKARLKYNGPAFKPNEQLDAPYGPEFIEANGKYFSPKTSTFAIEQDSNPGEWIATVTVPLKSLGKPRPLIMKMEIADAHAAPLRFETKLQVPKAPAP